MTHSRSISGSYRQQYWPLSGSVAATDVRTVRPLQAFTCPSGHSVYNVTRDLFFNLDDSHMSGPLSTLSDTLKIRALRYFPLNSQNIILVYCSRYYVITRTREKAPHRFDHQSSTLNILHRSGTKYFKSAQKAQGIVMAGLEPTTPPPP